MAGTKFALPNTTQKRMEMLERVARANAWESAVHQRDCIAKMLMFARTDIYAAVHGSDCPHQLEVHAVLGQLEAAGRGEANKPSLTVLLRVFAMCLGLDAEEVANRFCKKLLVPRNFEGTVSIAKEENLWQMMRRYNNTVGPGAQVSRTKMVQIANMPHDHSIAPPWSYRGYARYQYLDPIVNGPMESRQVKTAIPLPPLLDQWLHECYPNPEGMKSTGFRPRERRSPRKPKRARTA